MSSLDFGGGAAANSSRYYTYPFPGLPDGDWAIGCWIIPKTAPSVSPGNTVVLHSSPLAATANPGVFGYIDWASSPTDVFSIYAGGTGWTPAAGPFTGGAPTYNTTPVLVIVQRRSGNKEWYWAPAGSSPVAPDASAAFTGTTIASGTGYIGCYTGPNFYFTLPLGEFFLFNDRSLSAAQVAALAAGARPSAANVGGDPLILLPFRSGAGATEANLGTGGATYDATRVGTGFTTDADFFTLGTIEQEGFRFGADDGGEAAHTWLAAQDAAVTQPLSQNILLSMLLNVTGSPGAKTFKLQHRKVGDSTWIDTPME